MRKIHRISLKVDFTPNTLGFYGLRENFLRIFNVSVEQRARLGLPIRVHNFAMCIRNLLKRFGRNVNVLL